MAEKDFEQILDECIDRIYRGEGIDACLSDHPRQAAHLEPLLKAMTGIKTAYAFTPSTDAKRAAAHRFAAAVASRRQPSLRQKLSARRFALMAAGAAVTVIAVLLITVTPVFQEPAPSITIAAPSPEGNFAFLVSDDVNAIGDFSELKVTIEKVGLLQGGNYRRWIEFTPEIKEFDLTLLPGEVTQQLWRGDVPDGEYDKVVIYVGAVRGTLKASGEVLDIKLPSSKLQLSIPFRVVVGNVTSFTYDLTVVKTGRPGTGKYILKPQVSESGASRRSASSPPSKPQAGVNAAIFPPAVRPEKDQGKP